MYLHYILPHSGNYSLLPEVRMKRLLDVSLPARSALGDKLVYDMSANQHLAKGLV